MSLGLYDDMYWGEDPEEYDFGKKRNLAGKLQEYSQREYPYSYSEYAIYNSGEWSENDYAVYSDRLRSWYDDDTYNKAAEKHLKPGQWYVQDPEDVQNFLSELFGYKIKLTGIEQGCNVSNGFPYWIFYYRKV